MASGVNRIAIANTQDAGGMDKLEAELKATGANGKLTYPKKK